MSQCSCTSCPIFVSASLSPEHTNIQNSLQLANLVRPARSPAANTTPSCLASPCRATPRWVSRPRPPPIQPDSTNIEIITCTWDASIKWPACLQSRGSKNGVPKANGRDPLCYRAHDNVQRLSCLRSIQEGYAMPAGDKAKRALKYRDHGGFDNHESKSPFCICFECVTIREYLKTLPPCESKCILVGVRRGTDGDRRGTG